MNDDRIREIFGRAGVQRPEDAIGYLLWRVAHRHQRDMDRTLADLDLTHLQFVALVQTAWLGLVQKPVSQPALAAFTKIHPMQLSNVLKALEEKGLITRPRCPEDSRVKLCELTPAGIDALTETVPRAREHQRRFFEEIPGVGDALNTALRQIVASWGDEP